MLETLLTAVLIAQNPGEAREGAVPVQGSIELDRGSAYESAKLAARERARRFWSERAEAVAGGQISRLIPRALVRQAIDRFLARRPVEATFAIVEREDESREHEFGRSWQTTLWLAPDEKATRACERQLLADLRDAEQLVFWKAGGTVVFWALLSFALGWFDRLSRGYMTWRLRGIGLLLGAGVPGLAFLL
ncbi:MAG: hypothetical protein Fur0037_10590 [Planctomycetota bacterium]